MDWTPLREENLIYIRESLGEEFHIWTRTLFHMGVCLDIFTTAWTSIRFLRFRSDRFRELPVRIPSTTSALAYCLEQDATANLFFTLLG